MRAGWARAPLAEVVRHRKQFITIDDVTTYKRARVQLHARGIVLRDQVEGALVKTKKQQVCRAGEFLVAEIDAKVGGFGIVPDTLGGAIVSSHYFLFSIDESKLDRRFLDWCVRTRAFRDQVDAQGSTNYAAIRPADVLGYLIPLPPLTEQRRVVARIERLAATIHQASIVRREASAETAVVVRAELNRLFGNPYTGVAGALGIRDWKRIGDVSTDVADGPHATPAYVPEGVPFITVLNITSGRIRFGTNKFITPEEHAQFRERAKAEAGDVLISKDGTIGVPCFVDTARDFSFFVTVALVKPCRDTIDGEFLTWVLRTPYLQERMVERSRGDMIRHLVLREIRDLIVPVPDLREQRRIVAELDKLQVNADALTQLQAHSAIELGALVPAILERAFQGEL